MWSGACYLSSFGFFVFCVFQWGRLVPRADTCALAVTFGVLPTPDQPGWAEEYAILQYRDWPTCAES